MIDVVLVPPNTVVTSKGDSDPLDISTAAGKFLLATLTITKIVEQESIELLFFTSADGASWEAKPLTSLPQKFYPGEYPLLVDLSQANGAKFVRAHWEVNRWGRGSVSPSFEIGLRVREVPQELLNDIRAAARS